MRAPVIAAEALMDDTPCTCLNADVRQVGAWLTEAAYANVYRDGAVFAAKSWR